MFLNFNFRNSTNLSACLTYKIYNHCALPLRFVFLELGRFNKSIWELEMVYDKWMYLLKNMHKMDEIPKKFSDPLFTRLFLLAEIGNFTPEEHKQYLKSLENMGDYDNIINTTAEIAEKKGHEKGRAEGRIEGRIEGKVETARNLIELGLEVEVISKATGLSVEEIQKL